MADESFPFDVTDDDDDSNEDGSTQQVDDNKSIKAIRDSEARAQRQLKSASKELERLKAFEMEVLGERKEKAITSVFTEVGLNPKHAELFKRINPDVAVDAVTADAVKAFASEFELVTSAGETIEAPVERPAGFTPVVTGTGSPAKKLERDDLLKSLNDEDYENVKRAFEAGRVENDVPWKRYQG